MTKTYAACTPDTLHSLARLDIDHACFLLNLAGLPEEVAEQLKHKLQNELIAVWSTYGPGSIGAEVRTLVDAQAATSVAPPDHQEVSDEKVSQP